MIRAGDHIQINRQFHAISYDCDGKPIAIKVPIGAIGIIWCVETNIVLFEDAKVDKGARHFLVIPYSHWDQVCLADL